MQSRNGGFGAFDADNTHYYLNNIPFSDHGALLDPPTEDVTGRCLSMLAQLGEKPGANADLDRAIAYLRETQLADGSWYGRWGMNYIYGTWSVLCALNAAGLDPKSDLVRKAADWLIAIQNPDGGWGEDGTTYKLDYRGYEAGPQHRVADRLGPARADVGGADRRSRGRGAASHISPPPRPPTDSGTSRASPPPGSPACSTCAITAIESSSRCGRWRATAICRRPTAARLRSGCEVCCAMADSPVPTRLAREFVRSGAGIRFSETRFQKMAAIRLVARVGGRAKDASFA